jgi:primosomal replication protein N
VINAVEFEGELIEAEPLRFTPGGVAVVRFKLNHRSRRVEASSERDIECELGVLAINTDAKMMSSVALGSIVKVTGYLDRKGKSNKQVVLHALDIELVAVNKI